MCIRDRVLQVTQRRGSLSLHEALYVDARHGNGQRKLDDKLIARGIAAIDRRLPPALDLGPTLVGQPVVDPALVVGAPGGLDQAVTLQPGQGRIDLPDVQRPGAAGPRLELAAQLRAIHRLLRQQRQQPPSDRHPLSPLRCPMILSITLQTRRYTEYVSTSSETRSRCPSTEMPGPRSQRR